MLQSALELSQRQLGGKHHPRCIGPLLALGHTAAACATYGEAISWFTQVREMCHHTLITHLYDPVSESHKGDITDLMVHTGVRVTLVSHSKHMSHFSAACGRVMVISYTGNNSNR